MKGLKVAAAIWFISLGYTGYIIGAIYLLGFWGVVVGLLPLFVASAWAANS